MAYGELGMLGMAVGFPSQTGRADIGALLDLDFSWHEPTPFDLEAFPDWLDRAHQVIYSAFSSTILDHIMTEMRGDHS
jgi:uncharacterized protein (TIGR04255 family)